MQTEKITATDLGNGWHEHDKFGTFYDANNSSWYYHLDHGWIYVDEWDDIGTWMYMPLEDSNFTYLNEYFDGADFSPIVEWGSLAESTGLSLEFLQAISSAAGYDLNITSDENKTIHATNTKEPFGWAWTSSSTESFIYNNRLEEWFYYNKERENSDARYYSYTLKRYFSGKDIHKRNLSVDIWKEMLTEVGLKLLLQLDFDDSQISSELKNQPSVDSAFPSVMSINIPKAEINEDEFWFPLIGHLTNLKVI